MAATVGEVISLSLAQAKLDDTFAQLARRHYNMIMREQSEDFDWPFWRKTADRTTFISGTTRYAVPEDYSRSDLVHYYTAEGQRGSKILICSPYEFDQLRGSLGAGVPRYAYVDQESRELVFESAPASGSFELAYFRKGTEIDTEGGNDSDPVDFGSDSFIIKKLTAALLEYTDDDRQDAKDQKAEQKLVQMKRNVFDQDDNSVCELNSAKFRGGRRPMRGGGGWFGD